MNLLFTGALFDSSGYAEASRNYIGALSTVPGINLSAKSVSFESFRTNHNKYEELLNKAIANKTKPDVQIIHLTPENYSRLKIPGIKNIGYTVWETSKIPEQWVSMCNGMDEIWVPCDWNVEVFKSSGVTVPVKKVPHAIQIDTLQANKTFFGFPEDKYLFYSIFQWSARKNPEGLLRAYFSEFTSADNVCLVLKTYAFNNSSEDKDMIKKEILAIKEQMFLKDTPPISLLHGAYSREDMLAIHQQGSCFVLPHRAEGWGVPHFEAMSFGKPVISTGYSGNLEFMNRNNSVLIDFNLTPVTGMGRGTYHGKMDWAEPHLDCLRRSMRLAYEGKFDHLAQEAKKVNEKFSWTEVGKLMAKELGL